MSNENENSPERNDSRQSHQTGAFQLNEPTQGPVSASKRPRRNAVYTTEEAGGAIAITSRVPPSSVQHQEHQTQIAIVNGFRIPNQSNAISSSSAVSVPVQPARNLQITPVPPRAQNTIPRIGTIQNLPIGLYRAPSPTSVYGLLAIPSADVYESDVEIHVPNWGGLAVKGELATHTRQKWSRRMMVTGAPAQIAVSIGRRVVQPVNLGIFDPNGGADVFLPIYTEDMDREDLKSKGREYPSGELAPGAKFRMLTNVIGGMFSSLPYPPFSHMQLKRQSIRRHALGDRITKFENAILFSEQVCPYPNWARPKDGHEPLKSIYIYRNVPEELDSPYYHGPTRGSFENDIKTFAKDIEGEEVKDVPKLVADVSLALVSSIHHETVQVLRDFAFKLGNTSVKIVADLEHGLVLRNRKPSKADGSAIGFAHEISMLCRLRGVRGFIQSIGFVSSHNCGYIIESRRYVPFWDVSSHIPMMENPDEVLTSYTPKQYMIKALYDVRCAMDYLRSYSKHCWGNPDHEMFSGLNPSRCTLLHANICPQTIFYDKATGNTVLSGLDAVSACYRNEDGKTYRVITMNRAFQAGSSEYRSPLLTHALQGIHNRYPSFVRFTDYYAFGCFALELYYGKGWVARNSVVRSEQMPNATTRYWSQINLREITIPRIRDNVVSDPNLAFWRFVTAGVIGTLPLPVGSSLIPNADLKYVESARLQYA